MIDFSYGEAWAPPFEWAPLPSSRGGRTGLLPGLSRLFAGWRSTTRMTFVNWLMWTCLFGANFCSTRIGRAFLMTKTCPQKHPAI